MSLINDALKRAREAERLRGESPPNMRLQPVEPVPKRSFGLWLPMAVVGLLILSLWSFFRWAGTPSTPPKTGPSEVMGNRLPAPFASRVIPNRTVSNPSSVPATEPKVDPPRVLRESPDTTRAPISTRAAPSIPAGTDSAMTPAPGNSADASLPQPPPGLFELRLQSVIYSRNPIVVINGEVLRKGDSIGEARIIEVEPGRVTLSRSGTNLVLTLPSF